MGMEQYEDMLLMQRPTSTKHPRMSLYDRAAQFSPFAALTGHEEIIGETGRVTDEKVVLTEQKKEELDRILHVLMEQREETPLVQVTYFRPDDKKEGGCYLTATKRLVRVNRRERFLLFEDGLQISVDDIYELNMV